jgi:hypothetical protein
MGVLAPLNLLFLLSLVGLVLIYLRARTRSTVEVSSLLLFDEVQAPASSFRFLRLDVFFWLEALSLTVLSLALAGLFLRLRPSAGQGHRHALVFDLAAAMSAGEGSHTRLDEARAQALRLVNGAGPADQFSVVGYAGQPIVESPFTNDRIAIRRALDALRTEDVAATPAALAGALMRVREADHIDLFASRMPAGTQSLLNQGARLVFHPVGTPLDNAAITGLEPGTPNKSPGYCDVRNLSNHPMLVVVGISVAGNLVTRSTMIVPPKVTAIVPFGPLKVAGVVEARILSPDGLAADNVRYAYAIPERALKVIVLSPDPSVRDDLARVLRAVAPAAQVMAGDAAKLTPQDLAGFAGSHPDLLILHDSDEVAIDSTAKLLIFPHSGTNVRVRGTLAASQLDDRLDLGPLTRPLDLGPTRELSLPDWMDTVARGTGPQSSVVLTLAARGSGPHGRLGVIAFDIRGHRLMNPDMLDTLVLTVDLVKALTAPREVRVVATGSYVTIPATVAASVRAPDGSTFTLQPGYGDRVRLLPLHAGPYEVTLGQRKELILANYFDARESDLSVGAQGPANGGLGTQPPTAFAPVAPALPMRPIGVWLLVCALVAILLESALLARRAMQGGAQIV